MKYYFNSYASAKTSKSKFVPLWFSAESPVILNQESASQGNVREKILF